MTEVKVHEKYLVVIPRDVREALGIKIGETVEFVVEKGKAVLYPHRGSVASVRRVHGIIKHKDANIFIANFIKDSRLGESAKLYLEDVASGKESCL
jgi:AbrB family looped-hinge helix DNA binding protein